MKGAFENFLNAAANSINNMNNMNNMNGMNNMPPNSNAEPMSPELARIEQETRLAQTQMAMGMVKKLVIFAIIAGLLIVGGVIAFGVFSFNKMDDMRTKRHQHNERMLNDAIDRVQYGL